MVWALLGVVVVVYFIYRVAAAPKEQQQLEEWNRDRAYDGVADAIENAIHARYEFGEEPRVCWLANYSDMTFETLGGRVDEFDSDDRSELYRTDDGNWFTRPLSPTALAGARRYAKSCQENRAEPFDDDEDPITDATLDAAEVAFAEATAKEWTRCFPAQVPFLESNYQRCVEFFKSHPGLYPNMPDRVYVAKQYDPTKVWSPRPRVSAADFAASRQRLKQTSAALQAEYTRLKVPEIGRWELGYGGISGE